MEVGSWGREVSRAGETREFHLTLSFVVREDFLQGRMRMREMNGSGGGNSKVEASKVREKVTPLRNKQKNLGVAGAFWEIVVIKQKKGRGVDRGLAKEFGLFPRADGCHRRFKSRLVIFRLA